MKRPSQRLDPLLNLHRLRRGILKQLLATLRLRHDEERGRLEEWLREWGRVRAWSASRLASGSLAGHGQLMEAWDKSAETRRAEMKARLADLARQIEEADLRLVKVSQDLKMMATLKERRLARERELDARRDQRELDEMASHLAARP